MSSQNQEQNTSNNSENNNKEQEQERAAATTSSSSSGTTRTKTSTIISTTSSPSTYVGDLAPEVTEAMLWDHFRKIGQVLSVRVCVDFQTKRSLGYGYVNFSKPQEAQAAIEQLNGSIIANTNRPCRVDHIQRDPTARKSGVCNIVIKGLPLNIEQDAIRATFSRYGRITSMNLPKNNDGTFRGYCYVNFEKEDDAIRAVEEANDQLLDDGETTIHVERYKNLKQARETRKAQFTNTFISGLSEEIDTEEKLRDALTKKVVGIAVSSCVVRVAPGGDRQACVAVDTHEAAESLVSELNDKEVSPLSKPGEKLRASRFKAKQERKTEAEIARREKKLLRSQYPNLYVKHLDDTVTDDMLFRVFNRFGEVVNAKIKRDPSGQSREFGFVSFKDRDSAEDAIRTMSGSTELGARPLYIAHCVSKETRQAQLEEASLRRRTQQQQQQVRPSNNNNNNFGGPGVQMLNMNMNNSSNTNQMLMYSRQQPMNMHHQHHHNRSNAMAIATPAGFAGGNVPHHQQHHQHQRQMMPMAPMMRQQQQQQQQQNPQRQMQQQQQVPPQNQQQQTQRLTPQFLATLSPDQQKNVLGERLYEHIQGSHPQFASKITGMLLEMENAEILNLLETPNLLDAKISEALDVLQQHSTQ